MMRNIPFPFLMEETLDTIAKRAAEAKRVRREESIKLSPPDAKPHWPAIVEHKWFLSERLGRNTGNEVAALDYLENVARILRAPRVQSFLERTLASEGMQAFANMQQILRGIPNLSASPATRASAPPVKPVRIPARLIEEHRSAIEKHKWLLGERLGRDIGTKVAALDYFRNIKRERIPTLRQRITEALEAMMDASGPNSIANLERAMRSRR